MAGLLDSLTQVAELDFGARRARTQRAEAQLTQPTVPAEVTQGAGPAIEGALGGLIQAIEGDGDPLQIQIRRSLIEARLGQALRIPGFRLPTGQELEMQQIQGQIMLHERRKKLDSLVVDDAFGRMMDAKEKLGVDESILRDPDRFLAAVAIAKQSGVLPQGMEVSRSTLVNAGLDSARQTPQERTQQALATTTANVRDAAKVTEAVQAAAEGEGALGQSIDATIGAREDATGVNLGTGFLTDIDERRGALELQRAYMLLRDERGGVEGNQMLSAALLQRYGETIKDQLKGLRTNEMDQLVVGQGSGDAGVDDEAVYYLVGTLAQMARDTGQDLGALMQKLGLNYAGVDTQAWEAETQRIAAQGADG